MSTFIEVRDLGFVNFDRVKYFDVRMIDGTNPTAYNLILHFEKDFTRMTTLGPRDNVNLFQTKLRDAGIKVVGNI